MNEYGVLAGAN